MHWSSISFNESDVQQIFEEMGILNIENTNNSAKDDVKQHNFLWCNQACYLFNIEPYFDSNDEVNYIVLASNIADLVIKFNSYTATDLVFSIKETSLNSSIVAQSDLIWAVSNQATTKKYCSRTLKIMSS